MPPFTLRIHPTHIDFFHHGALRGTYHLDDPFKPHWHPLCTPLGHCLTLARPHDHIHHKGLMYALRTQDINFMEEVPCTPHEETGRQVHLALTHIQDTGPTVAFTQSLQWRGLSSARPVFDETRHISITHCPLGGFRLSWHAHLTTLEPLTLIQSKWSRPAFGDGAPINYHGLIIRLSRAWSGTGNHGFLADGRPTPAAEALGLRVHEACYYGAIDGCPTLTFASVTLRQFQNHRLCLRDTPFAWMTLGPSNGGPLTLPAHTTLDERYEIDLRDGHPTP